MCFIHTVYILPSTGFEDSVRVGRSERMRDIRHQTRGPLQILSESWTGNLPLLTHLNKSESNYILHLQKQLEVVSSYSNDCAELAQAAYLDDYNRRTKDKLFEIGEKLWFYLQTTVQINYRANGNLVQL